ncbi:MAG: UPF0147 family protein [archaeon]
MADEHLLDLIDCLSQIEEDDSVPKNVRCKVKNAILALQKGDEELKIKANRALQELDELSDDPNIPSYVRPQIWNVVSMLEGL